MLKYVFLDSHNLFGVNYGVTTNFLSKFGIESIMANCNTNDEIVNVAADADAVGLVDLNVNGELMDELKKCKVLIRYGVGYDTIAVKDATERDIAVCNLPDYCRPDVATHALGLILDCYRKITLHDRRLRNGHWNGNYGYRIKRLSSQKLGLIGFGNIARELVKYIKPFNMEVIAYDPRRKSNVFYESGVKRASLDEILKKSDIISIHAHLNKDTRHLINKKSIAKMKDGVIIVNTASGAIVSLDDLGEALKSGKVKAAGLGVIEGDPNVPLEHPIFACENAILNPHCSNHSIEAEIEQHLKVAKSVVEVLSGKLPYNCVNKEGLQRSHNRLILKSAV